MVTGAGHLPIKAARAERRPRDPSCRDRRQTHRLLTSIPSLLIAGVLAGCSSTATGPKEAPSTSTTAPSTTTVLPTTVSRTATTQATSHVSTFVLPGAPPCDTEPETGRRIRPTLIFFGCATSADNLMHITWSTWTTTAAAGTAMHNVNNCHPNCAEGTYTSFPVAVRLSDPAYLGGVFVFRTIMTTPTGRRGEAETSTATGLYGAWGWPAS